MRTRRQMAMEIGGRWLLRAVLRRFPAGNMRFWVPRQTRLQMIDRRMAELPIQRYADEPLDDLITKPAAELTDADKAKIRYLFYSSVNMSAGAMRRWLYDPRLRDSTSKTRQGASGTAFGSQTWFVLSREHVRALILLYSTTRRDGSGWRNDEYDIARKSIFVVKEMYHPRIIDYETWAILRTFGRDWERPTRLEPGRRLPPLVALEIELARQRYGVKEKDKPAGQQ